MDSGEMLYDELKRLSNEFLAERMDLIKLERETATEEGRPINPAFSFGLYHCDWPEDSGKLMSEFFNSRVIPFVELQRNSILHAVAEYLSQHQQK